MLTWSKPPPQDVRSAMHVTGPDWRPRSAGLLEEVDRFLRLGRPQEAVDAIGDRYLTCPWTANALAVAHLRLGNTARAVRLLRHIATDHTSSELRADVPMVFKTNLATALLAGGDVEAFLSTLDKLGGEDHPSVRRLRAVVDRWEGSLSAWQKFWWDFGGVALRPPRLDFPPGELPAQPGRGHNPTGRPPDGLPASVRTVGARAALSTAVGAAVTHVPGAAAKQVDRVDAGRPRRCRAA